MMKKYSLLFFLLLGSFLFSQSNSLFEQGNTYYNDGYYQNAIDAYKQVLEVDLHSAELYFNLANAHYKLNHIAPSIYYYEKALLLDPNHEDALNNIEFARKMTVDAIDILPQDQLSQSYRTLVKNFTKDQWSLFAIVTLWLALGSFLIYFFSYSSGYKRSFFGVTIVFLILFLGSLFISILESSSNIAYQPAIVFEQVSFRTEPNLRSEVLFQLHEGTKVTVEETINNWSKVSLSDGNIGWIFSESVKKIKE